MVQLSRHDSKKYQAVLQLKISISENLIAFSASSKSENIDDRNTTLDEFGETKVKKVKRSCRQLTPDEVDEIVQRRLNGEKVKVLSEQFNCHRTTISRVLKNRGVLDSAKAASLNDKKIVEMYNEMHSTKEIAKEFGVSPTTIANYLRKNGIKIRSRWDYK